SGRWLRWSAEDGLYTLAKLGDPAPGGRVFVDFFPFNGVSARGDAAMAALVEKPDGDLARAILRLDGCGAGRLFADGFEDGTADAWSVVVP
ncbi:MAG: hypothetical protein AAGM22_31365, partial [Acidobacteriota bacterium]